MTFQLGFDPPIRRKEYKEAGKFLRFNHDKNTWERGDGAGWFPVSVHFARTLFDKGWKVWGV